MKFKYLISAAMLAAASTASAVPAYPGLLERTLDDGSTVMVKMYGDEFFSYLTDENGFILEQNNNSLKYKLDAGARVLATPQLVEQMRVSSEATAPVKALRASQMQRMASLDKKGQSNFCTLGDVHFCVLLVQYDDVKFNSPTIKADMEDMLNGANYTKNGCKGSIREYYINSSGGKFTPTFDVYDVITLPKTSAYYTSEGTGIGRYNNIQEMVKTTIQLADDQVDFSQYQNVRFGECDAVIIFYAGYGQADTADTSCIWPHQGSVIYNDVYADDVQIASYCVFNELNGGAHYRNKDGAIAGIGTPIHEFGHVMGLPDLYDPNYAVKSTPSNWSVFDMGPYLGDGYCPPAFSAYERYLCNWLDYEQIAEGTHYELKNLNDSNRALRINVESTLDPTSNNEYWVLESRSKSGWDEYIPGQGMLIWHIDYSQSFWTSNRVNSTESRKRCCILSADGSANYDLGFNGETSENAAWPYRLNYLTPDTEITLKPYNAFAKDNDSWFANIAYDKETATSSFDYNIFKEHPTTTTIMTTPVRDIDRNGNPANNVLLSWEPVEGAQYALSIYRVNSSTGRVTYEYNTDGTFNELPMGDVTSYCLPLSTAKMKLEYHAYVRVIDGLPSSEKSNEIVFTGNNLEVSPTGIDGVIDESIPVVGMDGYIQAPADAEIYNLQGVRCPATGLAPGVYIVRTAANVTKVIVR